MPIFDERTRDSFRQLRIDLGFHDTFELVRQAEMTDDDLIPPPPVVVASGPCMFRTIGPGYETVRAGQLQWLTTYAVDLPYDTAVNLALDRLRVNGDREYEITAREKGEFLATALTLLVVEVGAGQEAAIASARTSAFQTGVTPGEVGASVPVEELEPVPAPEPAPAPAPPPSPPPPSPGTIVFPGPAPGVSSTPWRY